MSAPTVSATPPANAADPATLLRKVLEGASLTALARQYGDSGNAVRKRVVRLARRLQKIVGVIDVDDGAMPTVEMLRRHRAEFLEALTHYQPDQAAPSADRAATDDELELLLIHIDQHSRDGVRDRALVLLLFASGARPAEIAKLSVGDYLNADGRVRTCSLIPAAAASNGCPRPLFFTSMRLISALEAHLEQRRRSGQACAAQAFRGFDSRAPLIALGGQSRPETAASEVLRTAFSYLNRPGLNARSARRRAALKLHAMGVPHKRIADLLGVSRARAVAALLPVAPSVESAMAALA